MHSSRVGVRTSAWTSRLAGIDVLDHRQAEGGGLARARLRLADHVAPLEEHGDGLLLDRAGLLVAHVLQRVQGRLGEAEVGEGGHVSCSLRGVSGQPLGSSSTLPVVRRSAQVDLRLARPRTSG